MMQTRMFLRSYLFLVGFATLVFAGGLTAATAQADITVDSDATWSSPYAYAEDIRVIDGAVLTLDADGSGTTGNWYVTGSTIRSTYAGTSLVSPDHSFGSGTLYLTDSSLSAGVNQMNVSCPVVVSGSTKFTGGSQEIYVLGNISGSGVITEDLNWSIHLKGDNSAYTGDWILERDYTWLYNSSAAAQASWASGGATDGDYTFGSGTITVNGGMFATSLTDAYIYNDIVLTTPGSLFSKGGASLTLLGNLSGAGEFNVTSGSTPVTNLRGDNSDFTGAWNLQSRYVSTDNTSSTKVTNTAGDAADSRFGTGVITLDGGGIRASQNGANTSIYVHNDIAVGANGGNFDATNGVTLNVTGALTVGGAIQATGPGVLNVLGDISTSSAITNSTTGTLNLSGAVTSAGTIGNTSSGTINITGPLTAQAGFTLGSTGSGKILIDSSLAATAPIAVSGSNIITLNGALTGSSDITVSGGRFRVFGTTTGYSGNWHINGGRVVVNGGDAAGTSFGTGTVYLEGNSGAIVGFSSNMTTRSNAYIYNTIVVTGKNYLRSDGDPETIGAATANYQLYLGGAISSTDSLVTTADTDAMLIREGGGYCTYVYGANAGYQGNWLLKSDFVQTNNSTATVGNNATTHTDARFGSGTIYMQGGGIQGGGHVYNDITIQTGNTGNLRNNDFSLYGTVSVDGTLRTTTTNSDELVIFGELQGTGTVQNAKVTVGNGGVLDPGRVGVTYYTESSHTYAAQADDVTGTLTLRGGLGVDTGGTLAFDILNDTDFDRLMLDASSGFSDDMDLSDATLQLSFGDGFDWETCDMTALLIATEGTVTGLDSAAIQYVLAPGAAAVAALPENVLGGLSVTSDGVALTLRTIPEPSSLLLLILAVLGVYWRRGR